MLCAQKSIWRKFWQSQQRLRHHYWNKSFNIFLDEIRERRRAHELNDNVNLLLDPQQQNQQQNWIEFQNYHFKLHEWQKKKQNELQKNLNNIWKKINDTNMKNSKHATQQKKIIHQRFEYVKTILR